MSDNKIDKKFLKSQFSKSSKSPINILEKPTTRNDKRRHETSFIHKSFDQRNTISSRSSNKRMLSSNGRRTKNIKLDNIKQIEINLNLNSKKNSNAKINSERINIEYKNSFVNNSSLNNSGSNFYTKNKGDMILKTSSQTDRTKNSKTFIQNNKKNNNVIDIKTKKSPVQRTKFNISPNKTNSNSHLKNEKLVDFSPINTKNKERKKFIQKNILNNNESSPKNKKNIKNENNNILSNTYSNNTISNNNKNNNNNVNNKNNNTNKIVKPTSSQTNKNISSKHSSLKSFDKNDLKSSFNYNNKKNPSHKVIINECFESIHSKENKEFKKINVKKSKSLKEETENKNEIIGVTILDNNKINKNKEKKNKLSPLTQPIKKRSKSKPNEDINEDLNEDKNKDIIIEPNDILNNPTENIIKQDNIDNENINNNNMNNIINYENINFENNNENIINNNNKEINIDNINNNDDNNENINNYNNNNEKINDNINNYNNNYNNDNENISKNIILNNELENKNKLFLNEEENKEKDLETQYLNLQKLKNLQEIKQQLSQKNYKENELQSPKRTITFDKNYSSPDPKKPNITNSLKSETHNPKKSKTEKLENENIEIKFLPEPIIEKKKPKEKKNQNSENPKIENDIKIIKNNLLPNLTITTYLKKGYSPLIKKPNQDSIFISKISSSSLFIGVCDGHGTIGHEISSLIEKELPKILKSKLELLEISNIPKLEIEKIIKSSFKETNDKISLSPNLDSVFSGSTCCSLLITENKIISCNLGDSRGIIGKKNIKDNKWISENLTNDHKPDLIEEKNRILQNGGRVESYIDENGNQVGPVRVWKGNENVPGLAMSRSFGDEIAHCVGVICEPEIKEKVIESDVKFFVVASDGVWEFISSQECVDIVSKFYEDNNIEGAVHTLAQESRKRWIQEEEVIDDISIVIGFFN